MDYQTVKEKLELLKLKLINDMENPSLSKDEKEAIQKSIVNYEYIIELTDMNHFERGAVIQ
jgi:hypothetical protein